MTKRDTANIERKNFQVVLTTSIMDKVRTYSKKQRIAHSVLVDKAIIKYMLELGEITPDEAEKTGYNDFLIPKK